MVMSFTEKIQAIEQINEGLDWFPYIAAFYIFILFIKIFYKLKRNKKANIKKEIYGFTGMTLALCCYFNPILFLIPFAFALFISIQTVLLYLMFKEK